MAPSRDSLLTPIKIRGKRRSTWAEKWNTGKRRNPELQKRRMPAGKDSASSPSSSTKPRKRLRRGVAENEVAFAEEFSPLENLPAEVVQQIFEYSTNIELPLTSRQLASKLSKSQHLQYELTSRTLDPILRFSHGAAAPKDLAGATRLLNSKFVTWDFFQAWLLAKSTTLTLPSGADVDCGRLWAALQPSPGLLPPKKLLSPPFTQEKTRFLAVLAHSVDDITAMDAAYGELAYEGLVAAVEHAQLHAVTILLNMGLSTTTELLRVAVADSGCDEQLVRMLVGHSSHNGHDRESETRSTAGAIDLLDPILWTWAHNARSEGNEQGEWLMQVLRDAQRRQELFRDVDTPQRR